MKLSPMALKETVQDSDIGMKSWFVGHRFLKQAKNHVSDWSFRNNAIVC